MKDPEKIRRLPGEHTAVFRIHMQNEALYDAFRSTLADIYTQGIVQRSLRRVKCRGGSYMNPTCLKKNSMSQLCYPYIVPI